MVKSWNFWKFLGVITSKHCQFLMKDPPPNSCFVNNYFCDRLMAWEGAMDIQPVFKFYKAVAYMCAYLSKSEDKCSPGITQAVRGAFDRKLNNHEQMRSVANAYLNKRKCSIQECVYHVLPGLVYHFCN